MATFNDSDGVTQRNPTAAGVISHIPFQTFTQNVAFGDLGSGASDTIALTGFPTDVVIVSVRVEIVTAFGGEADLAMTLGDTVDADELIASFNLNAVAAGWAKIVAGAELLPHFEPDYATDGGAVTFTATELDDVTAGELNVYIDYYTPALSTL